MKKTVCATKTWPPRAPSARTWVFILGGGGGGGGGRGGDAISLLILNDKESPTTQIPTVH